MRSLNSYQWLLFLVTVPVMIVMAAAAAPDDPSPALSLDTPGMIDTLAAVSPDGRALVLSLDAPPMEGSTCYSCTACSGGRHYMHVQDDPVGDIWTIHHYCSTQSEDHDCEDHSLCEQTLAAAELGKLWRALEVYEGEDIRAVVAAYPAVHVNAERGSFQILASCGALVAQLPMTRTQLEAFALD